MFGNFKINSLAKYFEANRGREENCTSQEDVKDTKIL